MSDNANFEKGKMKNGECRTTRQGRKYCKRGGKVRFVKR